MVSIMTPPAEQMEQRYNELQAQFSLPEVLNDHENIRRAGRALREIRRNARR
jgi:peptide chain release factor 1